MIEVHSPVNAMIKSIVGGEHDDGATAHGQREETLDDSLLPDDGVQQLAPLGPQKEDDAVDGALQGDGSAQQGKEHDVGEQGQEIGRLAGTLHAAHYHQEYDDPRDKQRNGQLPVGRTDAI